VIKAMGLPAAKQALRDIGDARTVVGISCAARRYPVGKKTEG
jgi:hypothetical protein